MTIEHGDVVDRRARDRDELMSLMLDELRARVPGWEPDSVADIGVTIVELLASVADRLSYEQDTAATEAYIGTARRRTSLLRHARLLGVPVNNGCNARTWVYFEAASDEFDLARGTRLLTATDEHVAADGTARRDHYLERSLADRIIDESAPLVFETMHDSTLRRANNVLHLHADVPGPISLSAHATATAICGHVDLHAGDVLAIGHGTSVGNIGPVHVVRLSGPPKHTVAENGHPITVVEWCRNDAPRMPIEFAVDHHGADCSSGAIVLGNLVLADEGRTLEPRPLEPSPSAVSAWRLRARGLTHAEPMPLDTESDASARELLEQDPFAALPAVELEEPSGPVSVTWRAARDLIGAHRLARHFVIESVDDDWVDVRFGDDQHGRAAPLDSSMTATIRVGAGPAANIDIGSLAHMVGDALDGDPPVTRVTNLVPAIGGCGPETIEQIRQRVPHAWRHVESCVTPADYESRACEHPDVESANARWATDLTSGQDRIVLTVSTADGENSDALLDDVSEFLEPRRVVGHVLDIHHPAVVEFEADLDIFVGEASDPDVAERDVRSTVRQLFSPGRLQLGETVSNSRIVAVLSRLPKIRAVHVVRLARVSSADATGARDVTVEPWEVALLDAGTGLRISVHRLERA